MSKKIFNLIHDKLKRISLFYFLTKLEISIRYSNNGGFMKVYLDVIFITNFLFDFILLFCLSIVLKKQCKIIRLFFGALFGSITLFSLFIPMTNMELFLLKIIMSMGMILIAFKYKNRKTFLKDLIYLYIISIFCGGSIYFIYNQMGYKHEGLLFLNNGFHLNFIILVIFFFIAIYIYIKQSKDLKTKVSHYHQVDVYYKDQIFSCNGFLDTGNRLYDPYKHRPICLLYKNIEVDKPIYVCYKTIQKTGMLKCFLAQKIVVDHKYVYDKQLIGLSNEKFAIDGVDFILHSDLEGYND